MTDRLVAKAHAKVNLFLRIFGKDDSGYHGLETAFCLLELADELLVTRTEAGIELRVEGARLGAVEENLAYRAAAAVLAATGNTFGVEILLKKRIPVGGGLGGGSADAAATLQAVNALAGNRVPRHELLQLGARLGSDVPFLAAGMPLAVAWNRGERMFSLPPLESKPALLVVPDFGVNTAEAYRRLDSSRQTYGRGSVILKEESFASWSNVARLGGNDFEAVAFGRHPKLKELFFALAETRPILARMSGSGSTLFAIYRNETDARDANRTLEGKAPTLLTSTRAMAAPDPTPAPTALTDG